MSVAWSSNPDGECILRDMIPDNDGDESTCSTGASTVHVTNILYPYHHLQLLSKVFENVDKKKVRPYYNELIQSLDMDLQAFASFGVRSPKALIGSFYTLGLLTPTCRFMKREDLSDETKTDPKRKALLFLSQMDPEPRERVLDDLGKLNSGADGGNGGAASAGSSDLYVSPTSSEPLQETHSELYMGGPLRTVSTAISPLVVTESLICDEDLNIGTERSEKCGCWGQWFCCPSGRRGEQHQQRYDVFAPMPSNNNREVETNSESM